MEDVVELHCHGGIVPVRRIMEEVLKNGADIAEPGEFTKRFSERKNRSCAGGSSY